MSRPTVRRGGLYNTLRFRLNWNHFTNKQEAENVVKGLSRKVIIVKSPDPKILNRQFLLSGTTICPPRGWDRRSCSGRPGRQPTDM